MQKICSQDSHFISEENEEVEKNSKQRITQFDEEVNNSLKDESLISSENNNFPILKTSNLHNFPDDEIKIVLIEEEKVVNLPQDESQRCIVNYFFPVIRDFSKLLMRECAVKKESDSDAKEKYKEFCKCLEVVPISSFYECLLSTKIDLWFYGVNSKGMHAMTDALSYNSSVTILNLEGNHLTCDAVYHLGEMLRINATICELNLSGCKIGQKGAEILAHGIKTNSSLIWINLANNHIEDDGMKFLVKSFLEHFTLKKIILSNNNLFKKSAIRLGKMLEENCILLELDLSWNYLNSNEGLRMNTSLEYCDLTWNGLDDWAAGPIAKCLSANKTLQYLDISNNSFSDDDVIIIGEGLEKNISLKHLKIGMNSFSHRGAMGLLEALLEPKLPIEILDFENVIVEKEFKELLKEVSNVRKVQVLFGGYRSNYKIKGTDVKELLLKRAKFLAQKPKKYPKDFGQFILKLEDKPLKTEDFGARLKEAKIKLDKDLLGEILEAFKVNKAVNTKEMKDYYLKLFPDTKLVVRAKKTRKKGTKGKKSGDKEKKGKDSGDKEKKVRKSAKGKK